MTGDKKRAVFEAVILKDWGVSLGLNIVFEQFDLLKLCCCQIENFMFRKVYNLPLQEKLSDT